MKSMRMSGFIDIRKFLLEEDEYEGYSAKLIGNYFQGKLRAEKRDQSYRCPVCKGYGFLLTKGSPAQMEKDLEILADLAGASVSYALTGSFSAVKKDGSGYYSGATLAYKQIPIFKKIPGLKGIVSKHKSIIDANVKKEQNTIKDDAIEAKKTFNRIEKLAKNYIGVCQYCAGNGWLDVGHKNLEGKTTKLLLWVFNNYAVKGKNKVKVSTLYNEFKNYPIEPQWANSPGRDPYGLEYFNSNYVVNRFTEYVNAMGRAKISLRKKFEEFYKNGGQDLKEEEVLTYEAIDAFYPYLTDSRVKTGTLKEFETNEYRNFKKEFNRVQAQFNQINNVTHVVNPKTHKIEHRYPIDTFFFRGPTAWDRKKKGSKIKISWKNKLFVYASIYSGNYKPWKTEYLHNELSKYFSSTQMKFLRFFPQEYTQK